MVARKQAAQLPSLWSFESLLPSSRPASSPRLPHADTHSRIEHFASRYYQVWGRGIVRSLTWKGFSVEAKRMESGLWEHAQWGTWQPARPNTYGWLGRPPKLLIDPIVGLESLR